MTGAAIRASGWGWQHAGRSAPALTGLDLAVEPGERVLLLGPSGAGKSTLLAALAGVLGGDDEGQESGELRVDGEDPRSLRGRAGLVLQDPGANTILGRVGDDVAFGCENLGVPPDEIWRRVSSALDAVVLNVSLDRPTSHLSGGQRQRLALAGVIAMQPGLILLDEPTANLDPAGVLEVREAVASVVSTTGATLVVVEHRVETWLPVVDRVVALDASGGVAASGRPETVLRSSADALMAQGVWVPGVPVQIQRTKKSVGEVLLNAERLQSGREAPVHDELTIALNAGTSTVVTGPNGAGKSTLALTLAGLINPAEGAVVASPSLLGSGLTEPAPIRWRPRELISRIGMVFQEPQHQFVASTVRDEVAAGLRALRQPASEVDKTVETMLAELTLAHLADAHPFTLSGGEKRRLSVATVLAPAPRVIVLDEPTFGQDRSTWASLVRLIAKLVDDRGCAVVSVTHDADVERILGDRIVRLAAESQAAVGGSAP